MCTTTKAIYNCGHRVRRTDGCTDRLCARLDQWRCSKNSSCPGCNADTAERSQDRAEEWKHESNDGCLAEELSPVRFVHSPWMPSTPQHKEYISNKWTSSTRRAADQAWINEHESRMRDFNLASTLGQMSSRVSWSYHRSKSTRGTEESTRQYAELPSLQSRPAFSPLTTADGSYGYLESPFTSLATSPTVSPHPS